MIEKRVINPDQENITKRAVVRRRLPLEYHAKSNCKKTTTKELSKEQQDFYEEQAEKLRLKRERKFKNKWKK